MTYKDFIRDKFIADIRAYYKRNKALIRALDNQSADTIDEFIDLESVIERLDAELRLAVEEFEYNCDYEED